MERIIIVYGSTMGATETMSREIEQEIKSLGLAVTVKNVSATQPEELKEYEAIILGCSTWGDGELQEDFIDFEKEMRALDLTGKKVAVFGPGDSSYGLFCEAVNILEKTAKDCGADIAVEGLKVDGGVDSCIDQIRAWAKNVVPALN